MMRRLVFGNWQSCCILTMTVHFLSFFLLFLSLEACSDACPFCQWACLSSAKATYVCPPVFWHGMSMMSVCCIVFQDGIYLLSHVQGIGSFDAFQLLSIYTVWFLNFPSLYTGRLDQVHAVYLSVGAFLQVQKLCLHPQFHK